jgi:formylglycine-generating enzyme required for sulfatase activity
MKIIFNFKVALSTKSINNILRLATLAAACLALPTHALAQSSCPGDLNDDGEVNSADVGLVLLDYGPCPVFAPTISSVNPNYGPQTGGTVFVINGTNLNGATSVTVGGVAATIIAAYPTIIAATAPASATLGTKDVVVTTPGGTAFGAFSYGSVPSWATLIEFAPNPAVVTDATMRAAIIATGLAWHVRDTATQIEMVLVPAGMFVMGCTAANQYGCWDSENPTHSVTLTQAFYMGRYEVTQEQWVAKMVSNPSFYAGQSDSASRPVEQVSWNTIQGYLSATSMRLPSEAEWEYACRGNTTTAFNNGSSDVATVGTIAWYSSNSESQTHAVGGKVANALGLHDMAGNVWEWVNDWYAGYSSGAQTNPLGPVSGSQRVFRGGSWGSIATSVRSSDRVSIAPAHAGRDLGFRVVRDP